MGGNGEEAKRGAGSESRPKATDKGEEEDREEEELEPTESCELEDGDGPADVVRSHQYTDLCSKHNYC